MVTIYKGDKTASVPAGSFKRMFQPYGWSLKPPKAPKKGAKAAPESYPGKDPPAPQAGLTGDSKREDLEKMNDDALRQYASLLGIKTKGLKTRDDLMEAIQKAEE